MGRTPSSFFGLGNRGFGRIPAESRRLHPRALRPELCAPSRMLLRAAAFVVMPAALVSLVHCSGPQSDAHVATPPASTLATSDAGSAPTADAAAPETRDAG